MLRDSPRVLDVVGMLVRLGLAAVWLVSGTIKISEPGQTYVAVRAYDVLPAGMVDVVATALPLVELVLGLALLLGLASRIVAAASAVLVLVLIAAIAQAWARGLSIDCGCFGGGGQVEQGQTSYPLEILRDAGFLVLACWLLVRPSTWLSVDGWLRAGQRRDDVPADDDGDVDERRDAD